MTEDEMIGCDHGLNGHEFEQSPEDSEGQGSLACYSPWGHKESDMNNSSSVSLQMAQFHPILWLSNILLYICTTSLSTPPLMDILVAPSSGYCK